MTSKFDRFFNPKDGTYANVPIIPVHVEKFRGKRFFNTNVLIGNWYEDRWKYNESTHKPHDNFQLEYPRSPPDVVHRRRLIVGRDERPSRKILDHHEIDNRKQMISSYDEHYQRRGPYGHQQHNELRNWTILEKRWLPERTDHPLEDEPTQWGLTERKRSQSEFLRRDRTMPSFSEYATNYTGQRPPSRVMAIPRIYSTGAERTTTVSNETLARSNPIYDGDSMEIDHLSSIRRNETVPRSYFYRGQQAASSMRESLPSLSVAENSNSSGENLIRI